MDPQDIIRKVLARMAQLEITQNELASACELSQPHLSKVLSYKVKLANKTEHKLSAWLELADAATGTAPQGIVSDMATRLEALRPKKRMQIMELLRAIERLIDG